MGLFINFLMAYKMTDTIMRLPIWGAIVLYLVGAFVAAFLVQSHSFGTCTFGFLLLSVSLGIVLTYILNEYELSTVYMALAGTAIIAGIMMIAGTAFSSFFISIGRWLFFSLFAVIIVELIGIFFFRNVLAITDYIVVAIFGLFIGYDWARAQAYPKTVTNAVSCAADLYLDLVNILIRLLSILGDKKD